MAEHVNKHEKNGCIMYFIQGSLFMLEFSEQGYPESISI